MEKDTLNTYRDLTIRYGEAYNRYLVLVNAGGAVAMLAFIGTGHMTTPKVVIPLGFFLAGLICIGVSLLIAIGTSIQMQLEYLEHEIEAEVGSLKKFMRWQGRFRSFSFMCFTVGSYIGVTELWALLSAAQPQ